MDLRKLSEEGGEQRSRHGKQSLLRVHTRPSLTPPGGPAFLEHECLFSLPVAPCELPRNVVSNNSLLLFLTVWGSPWLRWQLSFVASRAVPERAYRDPSLCGGDAMETGPLRVLGVFKVSRKLPLDRAAPFPWGALLRVGLQKDPEEAACCCGLPQAQPLPSIPLVRMESQGQTGCGGEAVLGLSPGRQAHWGGRGTRLSSQRGDQSEPSNWGRIWK